jgi:hypothetical protein
MRWDIFLPWWNFQTSDKAPKCHDSRMVSYHTMTHSIQLESVVPLYCRQEFTDTFFFFMAGWSKEFLFFCFWITFFFLIIKDWNVKKIKNKIKI